VKRLLPESDSRGDWPRLTAQIVNRLAKDAPGDGLVFVNSPSDLPPADSGVRTLLDNTAYYFTTTVDLQGDRLVAGANTVILGSSSENCRIKSTGLTGSALVTSEWSLPMRGITLEADVALDLDATANANQALDWFGVNFTDCATVGTIASYGNVIWTDCALLNSAGLTFDGTIGTVGFNSCIFDGRTGATTITLPATLTITRRFRAIYSAFVSLSGETAINASTSATIPVEGYILDTVNFSGGGTYTSGILSNDNKALWINCRGITNSDSVATMYMQSNATATTIGATGTPVKVAGTTTAGANNQRFSHSSNRLTYDGARDRDFFVIGTGSLTNGTANNEYGLYIYKNGSAIVESEQYLTANASGRVENFTIQSIVPLSETDYIEVWIENITAANSATISFLNVIATPVT
jgi:hypothetical protein